MINRGDYVEHINGDVGVATNKENVEFYANNEYFTGSNTSSIRVLWLKGRLINTNEDLNKLETIVDSDKFKPMIARVIQGEERDRILKDLIKDYPQIKGDKSLCELLGYKVTMLNLKVKKVEGEGEAI